VLAVLRLVGVRNLIEFRFIADLGDLAFDHDVKTFGESVAPGRKNAIAEHGRSAKPPAALPFQ
jgi:hypothetical protein